MNLRILVILVSLFSFSQTKAQSFSMNKLPLDDWDLGNWKQVESVDNPYKKKAGFVLGNKLLFANTVGKMTSKLTTADATVRFEFMLGMGSEAIFYVQGKHGIVLNSTRTCGTILTKDGTVKLPNQTAGRKTGLWQTLEVTFSEATFGNALVLEKVILNGITIHQGYVLPSNGKNEGPIVFENTEGTVAVRNVEYLKYNGDKPLKISGLSYELFETNDWDKQFSKKSEKPSNAGKANELTSEFGVGLNRFLIVFRGDLEVEKDGKYALTADYAGKGELSIDGKIVLALTDESYRKPRTAFLDLTKGKHAIELKYQKVWWKPELGLFASGPEIRPYALHGEKSLPAPKLVGEITVSPKNNVEMVRSFVLFDGKKRTHAISVGSPIGVHYSYDLDQGALLYAWRGEFADVTDMLYERGEPQLLEPKGVQTKFSGKPMVAVLTDANAPMPDLLDAYKTLIFKSYSLDNEGLPTYNFNMNEAEISQKLTPTQEGFMVTVTANGGRNFYCKLAEGKSIVALGKGLYLVDNQYITLQPKVKPLIRNSAVGQEIIVPLMGTVNYWVGW